MNGQEKDLSNYWLRGWIYHINDQMKPELGDGWHRLGCWLIRMFLDESTLLRATTVHFISAFTETQILIDDPDRRQMSRGPWLNTPEDWWAQPWVMTEDNWTPCMIAAGFLDEDRAKFMAHALWKRWGFFWNYKTIGSTIINKDMPDVAKPDTWGVVMRSLNRWYFYPLLWLTDVWLLLAGLVRIVASIVYPSDTGPCLNHQLRLIQARKRWPTPVSFIARQLYTHLRMQPTDSLGSRMKGYAVYNVWVQYFDGDRNPPMDVVMKPLIWENL